MADYRPPLRDIQFVIEELCDLGSLIEHDRFSHVDIDTVRALLAEIGRFAADEIAPTNVDGDQIKARLVVNDDRPNEVATPDSFRAVYDKLVASGFTAIPFDPDYGGGGFPWLIAVAVQEMITSANMAFSLAPLLTQGAIDAIEHHGSDEQKALYLPKMLTGEWSGTMNLSEPQAGSDVGAVATKAFPNEDGSWSIRGTKIWITFGEHDMAENIVHLVLARTPDAPAGTRGISMFVVPKYLPTPDGGIGERNDVEVVSIEHKLGIHGSPTCVLAYGENADDPTGGAIGWLVGDECTGMRNMFTMMNNARLSVGLEGTAVAHRAYTHSVEYALERRQGTAPGGARGEQSPIVDHPDVRRMLMTQRAWIEALRGLHYLNAVWLDRVKVLDGDDRDRAERIAALLIPLSKGLGTDVGNEMASLAVQIFGGMGYVEETGIAQHMRDIRIGPIYEGTNGIQAQDLVMRKLGGDDGATVEELLGSYADVVDRLGADDSTARFSTHLESAFAAARESSTWLLKADDIRDRLGGATPYLRLLGTAVCGAISGRALLLAADRLSAGGLSDADRAFYEAKVATSRFFGENILPTANGHAAAATAGAADLHAIDATGL